MSTDEILHLLEALPSDSEEEWDSEDYIQQTSSSVEIFIQPPIDTAGDTDEDSGDEEHVNISNLPGQQLLAHAESTALQGSSKTEIEDTTTKKITKTQSKKKKNRTWIRKDLMKSADENLRRDIFKPNMADVPRNPNEIFELFLHNDVLEHLRNSTVVYAMQKGNHQFKLDIDEMKIFISILLLSGYCTVARKRMYWELNLDTRNELVVNAMRRNRFEEIIAYFHAADVTKLDKKLKFSKVQPLLNILNKIFAENSVIFGPVNISIDESMIPYYGRHPTKQFIKGKPIRWGYKGWVAATPLGYAIDIALYEGKSPYVCDDRRNKFGLGGEVVLNCLDKLETINNTMKYSLYFDNFFTSVKLIEEIQNRGHFGTGTIRKNRTENCPFMTEKKFSKLQRGSDEYFIEDSGKIILARWQDNGTVTIASNEHSVLPMAKVERFSSELKKRTHIPVPNVIQKYNKFMGGVDRLDQNISNYRVAIRGKKWYFPIICYLLNVTVNNAWLFAKAVDMMEIS